MSVTWIPVTSEMLWDDTNNLGSCGGFFENGMRWDDYLPRYHPVVWTHLEALRADILDGRRN